MIHRFWPDALSEFQARARFTRPQAQDKRFADKMEKSCFCWGTRERELWLFWRSQKPQPSWFFLCGFSILFTFLKREGERIALRTIWKQKTRQKKSMRLCKKVFAVQWTRGTAKENKFRRRCRCFLGEFMNICFDFRGHNFLSPFGTLFNFTVEEIRFRKSQSNRRFGLSFLFFL